MVSGDPAELQAYQALVASYEQGFPGQSIQLIHIPDEASYRQRLAADFTAGTPADIVLLSYRRYASFAARGMLEPVGPYLAASQVISQTDFYRAALTPYYWHRQLMCLPQNISSLAVYYNKALFDKAGLAYPADNWNWDKFVVTAQALTRDLDGDARPDQYGLGIEPTLVRLAPFIWQNKGTLVDNLDYPQRLELETPQALQAAQWLVDLQVNLHVVPDASAELSESSENRFINGRLAMYVNSRRGVPAYRQITGFDWDVAPLPANRGRRTNVLHADAYCLASASSEKPAAWQFIEYASSTEGQRVMAATGGTVPSRIAVAESPAFLDPLAKPAHSQVFLDAIRQLRALPVMENWPDIEDIVGDELKRAFYGDATVPEAMHTAVRRAEEYFKIHVAP